MAAKIEMSLDDIIKTEKIIFRRVGAKKQENGAGGCRRKIDNKPEQKLHGTANRQIGKPKGLSPRNQTTNHQINNLVGKNGVNSAWKHDLFTGGKQTITHARRNGTNSGPVKLFSDAIRALKRSKSVILDSRPKHIQLTISKEAVIRNQRPTFVPNKDNQGQKQRKPARQGVKVGGNRTKAKSVSAEELDAELDAYLNNLNY
ncbi:THO complex subunit 4-like [Contarinia nasturtii]|uniref:THO complex subunit 4-like n=1 Tax=Contarinia nasturtii TaxID=265458 RepID=UPI0012D471F3|nr:THO complex subunit 4-like [Contarinia nasturtii]